MSLLARRQAETTGDFQRFTWVELGPKTLSAQNPWTCPWSRRSASARLDSPRFGRFVANRDAHAMDVRLELCEFRRTATKSEERLEIVGAKVVVRGEQIDGKGKLRAEQIRSILGFEESAREGFELG